MPFVALTITCVYASMQVCLHTNLNNFQLCVCVHA